MAYGIPILCKILGHKYQTFKERNIKGHKEVWKHCVRCNRVQKDSTYNGR